MTAFKPVAGAKPAITVDPIGDLVSQTCTTTGTNAAGQCTVTIKSLETGTTTVTATYTGKAASSAATRPYTDSGVKTWIDYKVDVAPESAVNSIGDPHVFTVTVTKDSGDGEGFQPLAGAEPAITATGTGSITSIVVGTVTTPTSGTCTTDEAGQCLVTVNSAVAGSLVVTATYGTEVAGTERSWNDSGTKTWTSGEIQVVKKDDAGATLANVTFELFRDADKDGVIDTGESLGQKTTTAPTGTVDLVRPAVGN